MDVFVIVEARESFTGNRKPLCFQENKGRFEKYMQKVRYVVLEEFPEGVMGWAREHYQRNFMQIALSDASPNDVLIFSDIDEIPRGTVVKDVVARGIRTGEVFCLSLDQFQYYLNVKLAKKWERQGPRLIRVEDLTTFQGLRRVHAPTKGWTKDLLRQIAASRRMRRWVKRILVQDAGWHFTWMGGAQAVALKGGSINVHSTLPAGEKSLNWAHNRMNSLLDDDGAYELIHDNENLPAFIGKHRELFEEFVLQPEQVTVIKE